MPMITQFEDIQAWQKARELTREVYTISKNGEFGRDRGLRDQIRRASVSIMSNIAEGFERGGSKEFVQFLSIAKGSTGEVESHLYVALDQDYLTKKDFDCLKAMAASAKRLIAGFINYLKRSGIRGEKYRRPAPTRD